MHKYQRIHPNLSQKEIEQIYTIFVSMNPQNGLVRVDDVLETFRAAHKGQNLAQ